MVQLTINGKTIEVQAGTTILKAAQAAGIDIPTLCAHPELRPYGGCRLCLVEVEGLRLPQASCTLPVGPGMVVRTDTPALQANRRFVLNLIFSGSNHVCPYCLVSGGDCELQNAAYGEALSHWTLPPAWQSRAVDASHPDFIFDPNRCILCQRCIRACGELAGNFTLGIEQRGANSRVVADCHTPLGDSSCLACGLCVQVCPTGALFDRRSAYQGLTEHTHTTHSICLNCSLGCGIDVLTRDNRLVRITGDWSSPVSQGVVCRWGRYLPLDEKRERLLTPLVRRQGRLEPAGWHEALSTIAAALEKRGPDVAAVASTRLSAEALIAFHQLFAEKLHSPAVTCLEEGAPASAPDQPAETEFAAFQQADVVVVWGADLFHSHRVIESFIKRELPRGLKLVVVNSNPTPLDAPAHRVVRPAPGTDVEVIRELRAALSNSETTPAQPARPTGVEHDTLIRVADLIAAARNPVIVYGADVTPVAVTALAEFAQSLGGHTTLLNVRGQANSATTARLQLDRPFAAQPGQAVYVALGDDEATPRMLRWLSGAAFVAVQASYHSALTERADVVLPVAMWAEQAGHYLNLAGRLQTARRAIDAPAEVHSNLSALQAVAEHLGYTLDADWQQALFSHARSVNLAPVENY